MANNSILWLYFAIGITAILSILGALAISSAQYELSSGKKAITIEGKVICLPHKNSLFFGQSTTDECHVGFLGNNGNYYGLYFNEDDKYSKLLLSSAEGLDESFIVSGTITMPPPHYSDENFDGYDIVGVVNVFHVALSTMELHSDKEIGQ